MKILVTGATGKLGSLVVENLLKLTSTENIAVSVRDITKANYLKEKGIEVRFGDFDKPESLTTAFKGIDKLLIISTDGDNDTRIRQHKNAINAAKENNVKFIAYTSVGKADTNTLPLAIVHKETEKSIIETKIPYSFLRNNWYLENEISSFKEAVTTNIWTNSIDDAKVSWALRKDYAEAIAKVLVTDGHENTVYELSRKPVSVKELVGEISKVTGKEITVNNIDKTQYSEMLKSNGLPEPVVEFIVSLQTSITNGSLNVESEDFEKLLGHPVTSIEDSVKEIINNL